MVRVNAKEEGLLVSGRKTSKRVRVVQLMIVGLIALVAGWLGNFFVGTSCNFVSIPINVGGYGNQYRIRFGLWKYSPVDSALNGYSYCYPYGGQNSSHAAPVFPRVTNLLALLVGSYSLCVLWWYLVFGSVERTLWTSAVSSACVAGVFQLLTLSIFADPQIKCWEREGCTVGPAAVVTLVTALAWVGLGWELHYNRRLVFEEQPQHDGPLAVQAGDVNGNSNGDGGSGFQEVSGRSLGPAQQQQQFQQQLLDQQQSHEQAHTVSNLVPNLELSDLHGASQEFLDRFSSTSSQPYSPPELT